MNEADIDEACTPTANKGPCCSLLVLLVCMQSTYQHATASTPCLSQSCNTGTLYLLLDGFGQYMLLKSIWCLQSLYIVCMQYFAAAAGAAAARLVAEC